MDQCWITRHQNECGQLFASQSRTSPPNCVTTQRIDEHVSDEPQSQRDRIGKRCEGREEYRNLRSVQRHIQEVSGLRNSQLSNYRLYLHVVKVRLAVFQCERT